jgi:hypothetical protein
MFLKTFSALGMMLGSVLSYGHVRQRVFIHDNKDSKYGKESIVKWPDDSVIKISMQNFSGGIGAGATSAPSITATAARSLLGQAISEWSGSFRGLLLPLTLDLDGGSPYVIDSGCEYPVGSEGDVDGINNFLFESKLDTGCADPIASTGVIGVTKVRFSVSRGTIVEGDLQFDDNSFLFKTSGSNNLSSNPKQINLNDVAVHELGHFFGLDHSSVRNSTMLFAVAEEMQDTKDDDMMGLYSLYKPSNLSQITGKLVGSVRDENSQPVFGAVVFALDARTLKIVASELSNVNGAFEFCALPAGSYVIYLNRYTPFGQNIHAYYSGFGVSGVPTYTDEGTERCFNPGCVLMTEAITHTFWSKSPTSSAAQGGAAMKIVDVRAGEQTAFLNLTAKAAHPVLEDVPTGGSSSQASYLDLGEVRLARLSQSTLPLEDPSPPSTVGTDQYTFTLASSAKVRISTLALGLYSRLRLRMELFSSASIGGTDLAAQTDCTANTGNLAQAVVASAEDPMLICDLSAGSYVVRVTGNPVDCDLIPGNSLNCTNVQIGEAASTDVPFYLIGLDLNSNVGSVAAHPMAETLESSSSAATLIAGLPSCEDSSLETVNSEKSEPQAEGSCCGTIKDLSSRGGPSGPKTLFLSILLNPAFLYGLYWRFKRDRKWYLFYKGPCNTR